MKTPINALFLVSLTCMQYLSGAQAQGDILAITTGSTTATTLSTTTTTTGATATTSTSAGVATPSPAFQNTPGLQVSSPFNGMSVTQNTVLSISASLLDQQPISSIDISVAKSDGTSNTTIVNIPSGASVSASQIWNVTAAQYPVGDYLLNMIITPNTTAGSTTTTVASTTTVSAAPASSVVPVYYWQAIIHVIAPSNTTTTVPTSAASGLNGVSGVMTMFMAAGVAVLGSLLVL
ncbi:hypothetical protein EDD21DRAFT_368764 [Dissophora ornata]|nr:hypothetical protein BGZ58_000720 [Dissophora ornata]KAI8603565.1 hypothetical protein EDD21DRAFT_368764 [Dissophora ornata]